MFKNVVIISIDSLRADGINYNRDLIYGKGNHNQIKTPNLDKFAMEGTSFINAYSTNTYTTSAHASLFTGEYPLIHGIRIFFDFNQTLNPKINTIAEQLNSLSFQTFFYSDVPELFSHMNIWRGFNIKTYRRINWLFNSISDLKKDRNFIFIHVFDVHEPYLFIKDKDSVSKDNTDYYDAIKDIRKLLGIRSKLNQKLKPYDSWKEIRKTLEIHKFSEKEILKKYYELGIEKFDKKRYLIIMSRLNELGFNEKNTHFVILSDHGEGEYSFIEKNMFKHAGDLTESVVKIPLLTNIKTKNRNLISIKDVKKLVFNYKKLSQLANKYVYLETWQQSFWEIAQGKHRKGPEAFISQRGLVLKNGEKIILKGEPEFIIKNHKKYNNNIFLRRLYRSILQKYEDHNGMKYYLDKLNKKEVTKRNVIRLFLDSDELKMKKLWSVYKNNFLTDLKASSTKEHILLTKKYLLKNNNVKLDQLIFKLEDIKYMNKYALQEENIISYAQNHEDVVLQRIFSDITDGFYIDIGAADPSINSVTKHFYEKGWRGINIEPNDLFAKKLIEERPRDYTIPIGIGNKKMIETFYLCKEVPEWSTFSKKHMQIHSKHGIKFIKKRKKILPLKDVLEKYGVDVIHFLKIDVEGYEKEVILSNNWNKFKPFVVVVEADDSKEWEKPLLSYGYIFTLFDGLNRFYVRSDKKELLNRAIAPANCLDKYLSYYDLIKFQDLEKKCLAQNDQIIHLEAKNSLLKQKNENIQIKIMELEKEIELIKSSRFYKTVKFIKKFKIR